MSDELIDFPLDFFKDVLKEMRKKHEIDVEALRIALNRESEFRNRNIRPISKQELKEPPK